MVAVCTLLQVDADTGCVVGTTRQVKCPDTDTIITQFCKDGIWQTSDAERAKCGGMDNIMTWIVAIIIVVVLMFVFGRDK